MKYNERVVYFTVQLLKTLQENWDYEEVWRRGRIVQTDGTKKKYSTIMRKSRTVNLVNITNRFEKWRMQNGEEPRKNKKNEKKKDHDRNVVG